MRADFWHKRWAEGKTGFHLPVVNPMLQAHFDTLASKPGSTVFVPLSGKSLDIDWLASRAGRVIANELSPQAVEDFFSETGREPRRHRDGLLEWWSADNIDIACGDFFQLTAADLVDVDLVYDRAALVALPADMRQAYAAHMLGLLPPASSMLLVTLEYEQSRLDGPPFSVTGEEVQALYGDAFEIQCVQARDALEARFRERGLSAMQEKAYILRHCDNA